METSSHFAKRKTKPTSSVSRKILNNQRKKVCKKYPNNWNKIKNLNLKIRELKKKILIDFRKYFPNLEISITKNTYINPRVY